MKTLHAYTVATGAVYPEYVNAALDVATARLRLIVRAPAVNGREGPTACISLEPEEAVALARAILAEYAS